MEKEYLLEVKRLKELAGVKNEEEHSALVDIDPTDDVPSVKLDVDDN